MNTTALAYIGDAVYEIYVRERVLAASGQPGRVQAQGSPQAQGFRQAEKERQKAAFGAHVDALHKRAIRYVRADGQEMCIRDRCFPTLHPHLSAGELLSLCFLVSHPPHRIDRLLPSSVH